MAGKTYPLKPKKVPVVRTKNRRIVTPIPVPASVPILKELRKYEPVSMTGQPPVLWEKAEGCRVYDRWGNRWLDMSSGVLVANAGHGRREIVGAICRQARMPMLHNYCFPTELRAALAKRLVELAPKKLAKCFLLTTGGETTECAIKLMRTHGRKVGGDRKIGIVSFNRAFHGRTLGAQMIGGSPALKEWIVNVDKAMWQVPFPDGFWVEDTSFALFLKSLRKLKVGPDRIAGVISETYQGGSVAFWPKDYAQKMATWCKKHDIVLIMDEVQAGFGRTGTMWGFEHYGFVPDLACCGKGITSGLPLSAIIGRADLMDQYPPGSMTSTHTGNPICVVAALTNLELIVKEDLPARAAEVGAVLQDGLKAIKDRHADTCGAVMGKGMVSGLHMVKPGGIEPDAELAGRIVDLCVEKGLLMFHPVGFGGATVKIAPPLVTPKEAVQEGLEVLEEAIKEASE